MTTEELELLLEAQCEKKNLDYKADCPWDVSRFCKHLLAMANLKDGGTLVVGVENKEFRRVGVSNINVKSYSIDIMKDQMTQYADPFVNFEVYQAIGKDNKKYIVIRVLPFKDIPVICRKDDNNAGVSAGCIYYRNSNRRVESAPISNSSDMRDLIQLAAVRMMRNLKHIGYEIKSGDRDFLEKELGGL